MLPENAGKAELRSAWTGEAPVPTRPVHTSKNRAHASAR
jgi:hypothetical protein